MLTPEKKQIRCTLRGKLKKSFHLKRDKLYNKDIVTIGDYVSITLSEDGSGAIYDVRERENYLSRKAPRLKGAGFRGERLEQVIAANIDRFFIITSVVEPLFNNRALDRFLVSGESGHVEPIIVINKIDLDEQNILDEWAELYREIGYSVVMTSTVTGEGLEELKQCLPGKKNLFWGQSGVGKSSLLNELYPSLDLVVGDISGFTGKGTHTTVTAVMLDVGNDTFVIDTPGIREIEPFGIRKEDLGHYYREFTGFLHDCRYNTCTHHHEPGCAVIEAVNDGAIAAERYDSYLRLLDTIEDDIVYGG